MADGQEKTIDVAIPDQQEQEQDLEGADSTTIEQRERAADHATRRSTTDTNSVESSDVSNRNEGRGEGPDIVDGVLASHPSSDSTMKDA